MAGYRHHHGIERSCPITALRARGDLCTFYRSVERWADITTGGFNRIEAHGTHVYPRADPRPLLAAMLQAASGERGA